MKPGIDALRGLPLVGDLAPGLLTAVNEVADLARLGPDEVLFRDGDRPDEISFLLTGHVAGTVARSSGAEDVVEVLEPIRAIGLAAAILQAPAVIGARTATSARLIMLPAAPMRDMLLQNPALASALLLQAAGEMQAMATAIRELRLLSAPQRLAAYLLGLITDATMNPARLVLPIRKHLLAARIGCTPENLSRTIAVLRPLGVETRSSAVVIRDVPGLRAYAGVTGP
jgi:CRP/FNR family transcriptional regulator, transcriptional activator FtrB